MHEYLTWQPAIANGDGLLNSFSFTVFLLQCFNLYVHVFRTVKKSKQAGNQTSPYGSRLVQRSLLNKALHAK